MNVEDDATMEAWEESLADECNGDAELIEAFKLWADDHYPLATDADPSVIRDAFMGIYDNAATMAEEFFNDCHSESEIPTELLGYIDWESKGEDMILDGLTAYELSTYSTAYFWG